MWFVTLVLLLLAAYFLYDAFRDKDLTERRASSTTGGGAAVAAGAVGAAAAGVAAARAGSSSGHSATTQARSSSEGAQPGRAGTSSTRISTSYGGGESTVVQEGGAPANDGSGSATSTDSGTTGKRDPDGRLRFLSSPQGQPDDLTEIRGIGPVINEGLNNMGVYHFHQIANFNQEDIDNVNRELDFPGRIERENWIGQAASLAGAAGVAGMAADSAAEDDDDLVFDLTGAWNTDLVIEVQEHLKVLNTRESDAPRIGISREEYQALKSDDDDFFSRERLLEILDRLRLLTSR